MSHSTEHNNKLNLTQKESGLVRVGNSVAITNRLLNQEISELFNQGFCKLNSKKIKNVDRDYLFELEHSSNDQIIQNFSFQAESRSDYEEAVDIFSQVLKLKPQHSLTYTMIGILYFNWTNCDVSNDTYDADLFMEEAFTNLNRAIEIESRNTLAIFFRSRIENESSLFGIYRGTTIAIHSLTLALDIDVKFIAAYLYRGAIKSSKANRHIHEYGRPQIEDYLDAIHDFDSALSLDSTIAGAYYSRGKLRAVIKDYQGAVDDFSFALKFNFTRPKEIFFKRGQMRSKLGDKDGANQDFERAKNLKFV